MRKETLTYARAIGRLEEIVQALETGTTTIDELAGAVKEGVELVTWCRRKLRAAEVEVETALKALDQPDEARGGAATPARSGEIPEARGANLFENPSDAVGEEGLEPPTSSV
ncbi:MAG: exodeoxyribonuclease VII small subunit [Chthonomonadales bacterium]|nr:exodeoxyribonuclease VII small subunit [Chthonomonadales bacterium]